MANVTLHDKNTFEFVQALTTKKNVEENDWSEKLMSRPVGITPCPLDLRTWHFVIASLGLFITPNLERSWIMTVSHDIVGNFVVIALACECLETQMIQRTLMQQFLAQDILMQYIEMLSIRI